MNMKFNLETINWICYISLFKRFYNEILWGKRLPIFCYLNKQEDAESRLAVQEALSLMSSAYTDIDQSARILMEALITQNIEKVRLKMKKIGVRFLI